jgi:hypothetical protein
MQRGAWLVALALASCADVTIGHATIGSYHFNGSSWKFQLDSKELGVRALAAAPGEQIHVGTRGNMLSCDGSSCKGVATGTTFELNGVWTYLTEQQERRWIVVGENGTLLR